MRAVLVAVVALELAGCYRGGAPAPHLPQRPATTPRTAAISDPLTFLPVDSELVVVVDMRTLLGSGAWQRIEPLLLAKAREPLQLFKSTCGFDPIAGLRRISIGLRDLDGTSPSGVLVIRGIDRTAAIACAKRAQAPGTLAIDGDVVVLARDGGAPAVFAFVDPVTLVVLVGKDASAAAMTAVITRDAPLRGSPELGDLLALIPASDPVWFAVNGSASAFAKTAGLGFKPRGLLGSLNLTDGAAAQLRLRLDTPDQANNLSSLAQGQLGMAAQFFDEITIAAEDADVVVRMRMTQDQLDSMLNLFGPIAIP